MQGENITRISGVSAIGPEDQELYTDFFRQEYVSELYANNWAYITQACRGSGGLGHKYFDGTTLVSIGATHSRKL